MCVLVNVFFSILVHELGHVLFYKLATGDNHWRIWIGSGKTLLKTQRMTIKLAVYYGEYEVYGDSMESKSKAILTLLGGPLFSLMMAVVFLFLRLRIGTSDFGFISSDAVIFFLNGFLILNILMFLASIIPMRYFLEALKGAESDGLKIFNIIKSMKKNK